MVERGETLAAASGATASSARCAGGGRWPAGADAYRVVHGEGDGLPSLVVDRYGDYLAIQTLSQGTERAKPEIVSALVQLLEPEGHRRAQRPAGADARGPASRSSRCCTARCPRSVEVNEGDARFGVDLRRGQKTGLFLDQRENHLAARRYARGRALDCFTYDGGFALQVARECATR